MFGQPTLLKRFWRFGKYWGKYWLIDVVLEFVTFSLYTDC